MPALYYYGMEGGYQPQVQAEYVMTDAGLDDLEARIKVGYNDADMLDVFPYALGGYSLSMHLVRNGF